MTRPGSLDDQDQASLEAILACWPELAAVAAHVQALAAALMTERRGHYPEQWMTSARATGEPALRSFVTGLRTDQDAVTVGAVDLQVGLSSTAPTAGRGCEFAVVL